MAVTGGRGGGGRRRTSCVLGGRAGVATSRCRCSCPYEFGCGGARGGRARQVTGPGQLAGGWQMRPDDQCGWGGGWCRTRRRTRLWPAGVSLWRPRVVYHAGRGRDRHPERTPSFYFAHTAPYVGRTPRGQGPRRLPHIGRPSRRRWGCWRGLPLMPPPCLGRRRAGQRHPPPLFRTALAVLLTAAGAPNGEVWCGGAKGGAAAGAATAAVAGCPFVRSFWAALCLAREGTAAIPPSRRVHVRRRPPPRSSVGSPRPHRGGRGPALAGVAAAAACGVGGTGGMLGRVGAPRRRLP